MGKIDVETEDAYVSSPSSSPSVQSSSSSSSLSSSSSSPSSSSPSHSSSPSSVSVESDVESEELSVVVLLATADGVTPVELSDVVLLDVVTVSLPVNPPVAPVAEIRESASLSVSQVTEVPTLLTKGSATH